MLKIPTNNIHLKVNENPIDIILDDAEIEANSKVILFIFDWNESTLRIPIEEYTVVIQDDLTIIQVKCHRVWERKLYGFIA